MTSKHILERAETALELAQEFLLESEDEMFDEDEIDEEEENESESCDTKENEATTPVERENTDDEGKDRKGDSNGKEKDSTTDPKSKKSSKGMGKKLKSLMGVVMQPLGSKVNWKIDFNLGVNASNQKDKSGNKVNSKIEKADAPRNPKKSEQLSENDKKIASLENENKRLEKIAHKFLDECIRLKTRVGELSEVEAQLTAVKADNERLKAELLEQQKLRQSLAENLATQTEEHRKEVKRLDEELRVAKTDFTKLKCKSQEQEQEILRLRKELEALSTQHANLKKEMDCKAEQYLLEVTKLNESLEQIETEKSELNLLLEKLKADLQIAHEHNTNASTQNAQLQQKMRAMENDKNMIALQYEASNAKVSELRRAIHVLESNAFTTTTAQTPSDGSFSCPICGAQFTSLANMQLHAEDCNA
ncbi:optineurin [Anopheles merus]|uniref:Uncharacterized protein n=1 Tax=Anopheles merus TaxID=30066 RepID=A0A182V7D2_ANOME|nr:optineurin [Anopheles merus]